MFRYSSFLDTLFKAMTHKYIRRVPKGVTKTGKTKYMYFYAGQEGHGRGIAHESELVEGASFAFGELGKTRYHAHISKVDGDKITVKYDDGAKKGTEETMTKKQFQTLVHGEHATGIKEAQAKADKQLKDFQVGKEKGTKVKQETLDKLEAQANKLKEITGTKKEELDAQDNRPEATLEKVRDILKNAILSGGTRHKIYQSHNTAWNPPKLHDFLGYLEDIVKMSRGDKDQPYKPFTITKDMLSQSFNHSALSEFLFGAWTLMPKVYEENYKKLSAQNVLRVFGPSTSDTNLRWFSAKDKRKNVVVGDKNTSLSDKDYFEKLDGRNIYTRDYQGVLAFVPPEISKKEFVDDFLMDALNQIQSGQDMKDVYENVTNKMKNKIQSIIDKKVQEADDIVNASTSPTEVTNLEDQSGRNILENLLNIASVRGKGTKANNIIYDPSTNTLFLHLEGVKDDGFRDMTILLKNPSNIKPSTSFDTTNKAPIRFSENGLKQLMRTKQKEITIEPTHGSSDDDSERQKNVIDKMAGMLAMSDNAIKIDFDDGLRNTLAKIPDKPGKNIKEYLEFKPSKQDENKIDLYLKQRDASGKYTDEKIGQMGGALGNHPASTVVFPPSTLKALEPYITDLTYTPKFGHSKMMMTNATGNLRILMDKNYKD